MDPAEAALNNLSTLTPLKWKGRWRSKLQLQKKADNGKIATPHSQVVEILEQTPFASHVPPQVHPSGSLCTVVQITSHAGGPYLCPCIGDSAHDGSSQVRTCPVFCKCTYRSSMFPWGRCTLLHVIQMLQLCKKQWVGCSLTKHMMHEMICSHA